MVLIVLLVLARIQPLDAALVFAGLLLAAALVPRPAAPAVVGEPRTAAERQPDDAMGRFAAALPDPCIVLDRRSVVTHRNPHAARQFPDVRVGDPLAFSLRAPALLNALEAVRRTGAAQTIEMHQTLPTETWHRVSVAPLGDGDAAPGR